MTRKCVICGKNIRTGRKYCFEHRNRVVDNTDKKLEKLNRLYKTQGGDKFRFKIAGIIFLSFVSTPFLMLLPQNVFGFIIIGIYVLLILGFMVYLAIKQYLEKLDYELKIYNRDPDYEDFVRAHVQAEKEEKDYKKKLLSS